MLLFEGEMVMFERSRSWIESVEMCCAEGVSYDSEVSRVVCVVALESSVTVASIGSGSAASRWEACSS